MGNRRKCYGIVDGLGRKNLGWKGNGANITNGLDNRSSLDEGCGVGRNDRRLGDRTVLDTWRLSRSRYGKGVGLSYSLVHRNGLRVRRRDVDRRVLGDGLLITLVLIPNGLRVRIIISNGLRYVNRLGSFEGAAWFRVKISIELLRFGPNQGSQRRNQ